MLSLIQQYPLLENGAVRLVETSGLVRIYSCRSRSNCLVFLLLQGGLIIARAERADINQIQDLKGKVVEAQVKSVYASACRCKSCRVADQVCSTFGITHVFSANHRDRCPHLGRSSSKRNLSIPGSCRGTVFIPNEVSRINLKEHRR